MELGRLGVWYPADRLDGPGLAALARQVEELGYGTLWYPEARGYESFTLAAHLLASTTRLKEASDALTTTRTFDVVTAGKVILRQTLLLPVTTPPGTVVHAPPVQYCTSNEVTP